MTVTLSDVQVYVGAEADEHVDLLTNCLAEAGAMVTKFVGGSLVPEAILDRATLEVAADLFNRREAPNGITNAQYATADGFAAGMRINRDPMAAAYEILRRWVLPW